MPAILLVSLLALGCTGLRGANAADTSLGPEADPAYNPRDPLEPANRVFYRFNEELDKYLLKPAARAYLKAVPSIARTGIGNFFDNLAYPNVILNDFLQGKLDQGLSDTARFIFNSTFGLAGVVDIGRTLGLPRHEEDLGQTLAVWGIGQGPYLYLPFLGPNTPRMLPDLVVSSLLDPINYTDFNYVTLPLRIVDRRSSLLKAERVLDAAAVDRYTFLREAWLQRRRYLIYDGNPPLEDYGEIFEGEEEE